MLVSQDLKYRYKQDEKKYHHISILSLQITG